MKRSEMRTISGGGTTVLMKQGTLIFKKSKKSLLIKIGRDWSSTPLRLTNNGLIYSVLRNIYEIKVKSLFLYSNYKYRISHLASVMHHYLNRNQKVPI